MKHIVLLGILDQFADWEAAYVSSGIQVLGHDHFQVKTVSADTNPVKSMGGLTVIPDYCPETIPYTFAGVILIGGLSWRGEKAQDLIPLIRTAVFQNKVLGGICDASAFLGTLGLLNYCSHTSNDLEDLKALAGPAYTGEAHYLREPVVRDGTIVTAKGTAPLEFALEVALALELTSREKIMEWYNFFHNSGC